MFVFLLLFRFIIGSDVSLLLLWVSQAMSCFVVVVVAVDVVVGGAESSVQMCHHRQICTVGCCHTLVWVLRCWSNWCRRVVVVAVVPVNLSWGISWWRKANFICFN